MEEIKMEEYKKRLLIEFSELNTKKNKLEEFIGTIKFEGLDMSQDLMYYDGKRRVIEKLRSSYPDKKIVFSGDSLWDYESGQIADLFVAYTGVVARPKVTAIAQYVASTPEELYTYITDTFTL